MLTLPIEKEVLSYNSGILYRESKAAATIEEIVAAIEEAANERI
ncbi:MAG: hypothetical protein QNJ54_37760 [Prochloraceae cyanobacterium]|nr:hypothetical protein [Prochloraceae cyanobacterium]